MSPIVVKFSNLSVHIDIVSNAFPSAFLFFLDYFGIQKFNTDLSISGHLLAVFNVNPCCLILFQNIKNIDVGKFDFSTVDELVSYYSNGLNMILDDLALFHLHIQLLGLHLNCISSEQKAIH